MQHLNILKKQKRIDFYFKENIKVKRSDFQNVLLFVFSTQNVASLDKRSQKSFPDEVEAKSSKQVIYREQSACVSPSARYRNALRGFLLFIH